MGSDSAGDRIEGGAQNIRGTETTEPATTTPAFFGENPPVVLQPSSGPGWWRTSDVNSGGVAVPGGNTNIHDSATSGLDKKPLVSDTIQLVIFLYI